MKQSVLLTHRENVAWQIEEVYTWHLWLVWVALRSMQRIAVDHLVRPRVHFHALMAFHHFCSGHAVVTSNAGHVAAIEPANDAISNGVTLATHNYVIVMNVFHCVQCDLE